jgi:hypothetical protein
VAEADEPVSSPVVDRFRSEGRTFLTTPGGSELTADSVIDISHENLIRLWHRLRDWADEEALSAERYRRLARAAELHATGEEALWRDPALQLALDWKDKERPNGHWAERYHPGFEEAMSFLDQSRKGQEKRRRRGVVLTVALWLLTAGSVLATIYAMRRVGDGALRQPSSRSFASRTRAVLTPSPSVPTAGFWRPGAWTRPPWSSRPRPARSSSASRTRRLFTPSPSSPSASGTGSGARGATGSGSRP